MGKEYVLEITGPDVQDFELDEEGFPTGRTFAIIEINEDGTAEIVDSNYPTREAAGRVLTK